MKNQYFTVETLYHLLEKNKKLIRKDFDKELSLCDSTIENQVYLHKSLTKNFNEEFLETKIKPLSTPKQLSQFLLLRNIFYSNSAYLLLSEALPNPATNVMRTVFESILRIFSLNLFEGESLQFLVKYMTSQVEGPSEREILRKEYGFFSTSKMLRRLYTRSVQRGMGKAYKELCETAHASIVGEMSDLEYKKNVYRDKMSMLLALVMYDSHLYLEVFSDDLNKVQIETIYNDVNEIGKRLSDVPAILPNKEKVKKKLKFDLFNQIMPPLPS